MDKSAFEEHYRQVYRDLYRFAWYTLKNEADAEDAVSDAVMDAWKGLHTLRDDGAFRAWIFKILAAKCKRKLKEYVSRTVSLDEGVAGQEDSVTRMDMLEAENTGSLDEAQDVREAYRELEEEEKLIVSLSVFGGYNSKEIGEYLELKDTTVRSKLSRAIGKMQVRLGA